MRLEDLLNQIEGTSYKNSKAFKEQDQKIRKLFKSYRDRHIEATKKSPSFNSDMHEHIIELAFSTSAEIYDYFRVKLESEKNNVSLIDIITEKSKDWAEKDQLDFIRTVSHGKLIFHQLVLPVIVEHFMNVFDQQLDDNSLINLTDSISEQELEDDLNDTLRDIRDKKDI
tara:strand:- start:307 stop:816 length:510 start_codon:yes stop_codon:yes gene_type:complete